MVCAKKQEAGDSETTNDGPVARAGHETHLQDAQQVGLLLPLLERFFQLHVPFRDEQPDHATVLQALVLPDRVRQPSAACHANKNTFHLP